MKNKKGFVFLESVIVLVVVALALTGFLTTYTLLSNRNKRREYYDKTSDKYLLYAISSMGTDGKNNYTTCSPANSVSMYRGNMGNCLTKFFANETVATDMLDSTSLVYLYYIEDIEVALSGNNKPTEKYDNGAIEYMKTLPINKFNYLIGVFRRSDRFYYASINLNKTTNKFSSANNSLASLEISGIPKYNNPTEFITVEVETDTVTLKFVPANEDSIVKVKNGTSEVNPTNNNSEYTITNVSAGSDITITLVPPNQDNTKIKEYRIIINRKQE